MKILVLSDSHSNIKLMVDVFNKENPDMIFHLGDYIKDAITLQQYTKDVAVEFVKGNNDYRYSYEKEKIMRVDNKRIFFTHGHYYHVKRGPSEVKKKGKLLSSDITLYGHTHIPYLKYEDNMWLMNPGTINYAIYKGEYPSYGIIEINNDKIKCKIIRI